jgi:hypothetical protein
MVGGAFLGSFKEEYLMSRFSKLVCSVAAFLVIATAGMKARADTITIVGTNSGQASTATIVCDFNSQTNTLTFTVTNTSAITSPGSTSTITGIGYDLPPTGNASSSGLNGFTGQQAPSLSSNFTFSDADVGNVPAGFNNVVLDFAFITGPNFTGGTPNDGLAPGESASFTVTGAAFSGFTAEQICNAVFVRFQNVPGVSSDVGTPTSVPEPSSILLLGGALLGLGGIGRRKLRSRN